MASSSSSIFHSPPAPREGHLFSLLKRIHALPNLPPLLHGLTFPERLIDSHDLSPSPLEPDHPLLATLQAAVHALEEYQALSPLLREAREIYQAYLKKLCAAQGEAQRKLLNGPARLFAALQKGQIALFVIRERGEELISLGLYASGFGTEAIFSSEGVPCQRESLEKIFSHSLLARPEFAPLLSDLPRQGMQIEECSPFTALYSWIVPRLAPLSKGGRTEAIETLFLLPSPLDCFRRAALASPFRSSHSSPSPLWSEREAEERARSPDNPRRLPSGSGSPDEARR